MKTSVVVCLLIALFMGGCAALEGREAPRVEAMFRATGTEAPGVLTLTRPALVADVNGAYEIRSLSFRRSASLGADGVVAAGSNAVFSLDFTDLGDIAVLRTDDKDVSLRAELGPEGKVTRALLGSDRGRVNDGYLNFGNDVFESGAYQLLYDGPDLVVGRIDLKFRKYTVAVNFRAPRLR